MLRSQIDWVTVFLLMVFLGTAFAENRPEDHGSNDSTDKTEVTQKPAQKTPKPKTISTSTSTSSSSKTPRSSSTSSRTTPSKPATSTTTPGSVPQITRGQALAVGIKRLKIPKSALNELAEITADRPQISAEQFNQVIDAMTELPPVVLSKELGTQLKELFQEELSGVDGSELGKEINTAVQTVLKEPDPDAELAAKSEKVDSFFDDEPNDGKPQISKAPSKELGSIDSLLSKKFDEILGSKKADANGAKADEAGKAKAPDEISQKLAKADDLLKRLESQQADLGRGALKNGGGILDALKSAIGDLKGDKKDEEKDGGSADDLSKGLKDALSHNPTPPPEKKDDDDNKKDNKLPEPPKADDNKNDKKDNLAALLGALKNNKSSNKDGNQNGESKKEGDGFSLPEKKDPEPEEKTAKNSDLSDLAKNGDAPQDPAVDPSQLINALKAAKNGGGASTTSLPGISGGGGFGGGFGGGGFGGFGGGGGSFGPNITGGGSAPPSGGFDGDPFSNLGNGGMGGPGGSFNLSKKVSYGSGGGSLAEGSSDSGGGDYGGTTVIVRRKNKAAGLEVLPARKKEHSSLLDYIGNLSNTICKGTGVQDVAVCKRMSGRKYLSDLRKRKAGGQNPK